jgi:hypothetical protein
MDRHQKFSILNMAELIFLIILFYNGNDDHGRVW